MGVNMEKTEWQGGGGGARVLFLFLIQWARRRLQGMLVIEVNGNLGESEPRDCRRP